MQKDQNLVGYYWFGSRYGDVKPFVGEVIGSTFTKLEGKNNLIVRSDSLELDKWPISIDQNSNVRVIAQHYVFRKLSPLELELL